MNQSINSTAVRGAVFTARSTNLKVLYLYGLCFDCKMLCTYHFVIGFFGFYFNRVGAVACTTIVVVVITAVGTVDGASTTA